MKNKSLEAQEDLTLSIEYKKPSRFWRVILILFFLFLVITGINTFIVYRRAKKYQEQFLRGAEISQEDLLNTIESFRQDSAHLLENQDQAIKKKTLLILGADQLAGRDDGAILTDTMILLQLDLQNNQIKTIALPRDIYHSAYQTRINALYYYGLEDNPDEPLDFPARAISELTGIDIDHTLLIEIDALEELIDLVGGVEITIEEGFTDPLFPRKNVDVSIETDPAILYESIVFEEGQEKMDGNRAMQYMRSRNSGDDQGNDLARGHRQQVVLQALLKQILNLDFLLNEPEKFGQLYRFYLNHFAQSLSVNEVGRIATSWLIIHNEDEEIAAPKFISFAIPVYPENADGLIYNPPLWQTQRQWIYQIRDLEIFKKTLQDFLANNELN
ncbi:MAG: hypothetical protein GX559_01990 [Candidatus Pacebacteria bacterium]|nr:hypothetical protein [Candidatus Paceibacterota bacterium]